MDGGAGGVSARPISLLSLSLLGSPKTTITTTTTTITTWDGAGGGGDGGYWGFVDSKFPDNGLWT